MAVLNVLCMHLTRVLALNKFGMQKLLEGEERSGRALKQQLLDLKQQLLTASASQPHSADANALHVRAYHVTSCIYVAMLLDVTSQSKTVTL